ncbi:MAG: prepilin-type N-terminal cleavage/methylation domain-containing protein [Acidobacteria bacterium]|nr:prepilin-type N-terminal cleavage/methylation domain-containing protein [Acidobacteriota bacterium]
MRSSRGVSLVEVLVATTVMSVGITALAHLFVLAMAANVRARASTIATMLAQEKMEQLRADGDLAPSPAGALARDLAGYHDAADGGFVRRWSVEPLPADPDVLVLQVVVWRPPAREQVRLVSVLTPVAPRP